MKKLRNFVNYNRFGFYNPVSYYKFFNFSMKNFGARYATIVKKITESFNPTHLEVINESYLHNVPKGSETHFKVIVVSEQFKNKSAIENHRTVNKCLEYELNNGIKALSIFAKTPDEYNRSDKKIPVSPNCLGGQKIKKEDKVL